MSYRHGVYVSEVPTSIVPPRRVETALPFVVGTAPIEQLENKKINEPVLCFTYKEFVDNFGWSDDFEKYTLCEFAKAYFALYTAAPVVFVNVYDPSVFKDSNSNPDPTAVRGTDIIGGIDPTSGKKTGLELVSDVFSRFRMIVGSIVAPKFSADPAVASVMGAKASLINSHFKAMAIVDVPESVDKYSDVPAYKDDNGLTDEHMVVCWPKLKVGNEKYWMSSHVAGLLSSLDAEENVPYRSPSNHRFEATGAFVGANEVWLGPEEAGYLNGNGIVTALNFVGGWRCWGNRTAAYPANTDVKDTFIPIRRMFNYIGNTLVLTAWQKLDYPITKRLIETVVDSFNIWLNGLAAREFILGGRVAFLKEENPTTDIMDGVIKFHVYITPPSPAREIDFIVEYDPAYIKTLF